MEEGKIGHKKIIINTLFSVLSMMVIIFLLNSWPNIKESFNGNVPPVNDWFKYITKWSNLISILLFGAFFYYRRWSEQKELMRQQKELTTKHQNWLDTQ